MSFRPALIKNASNQPSGSLRKEAEDILNVIYKEAPWKWPNGLTVDCHDDMYLIRKEADNKAIGFTGWQVRKEAGGKTGYYTVGLLPEYRGDGLAKEAVSKLLSKKASEVDTVKALIVEGNNESVGLAKALEVKHFIVKKANRVGWGMVGGALANTAFWDSVMHPDAPLSESFNPLKWDKERAQMGGLNALLGAAGGGMMGRGMGGNAKGVFLPSNVSGGIGTLAMSPLKDLAMKGIPAMDHATNMFDSVANKAREAAQPNGMDTKTKLMLGGLGVAGVGALGYGAHKLSKSVDNLQSKAKVRVTLPTRKPGDVETTVELPMSDLALSNKSNSRLIRDTKRHIRQESTEREDEQREKKKKKDNVQEAEVVQKEAASISPPGAPMGGATPMDAAAPMPVSKTPWASNQTLATGLPPNPQQEETYKQVQDLTKQVEGLTMKLKEKGGEATPGASVSGLSYDPIGISTRVSSALKLLGRKPVTGGPSMSKGAANPLPMQGKAPTPVAAVQNGYDMANRSYRGNPGIQTPMNLRQVPFGKGLHQLGSMVKPFVAPTPAVSGRAQFQPDTPFQGIADKLLGLLGKSQMM